MITPTKNNKPWEVRGLLGGLVPQPTFAVPAAKVALMLFMVIVVVLFSLFTVTYYLRMTLGDWVPISTPSLLWFNTALLVASSVFFQWSRAVLRRKPVSSARPLFLIGGLLAIAFIAGQAMVWNQLQAQELFVAGNPANAFFYLMTGLHVVHLLGGLWVWARTSLLLLRGAASQRTLLSMELCTLYWHFLLLVWVVLFAILANS